MHVNGTAAEQALATEMARLYKACQTDAGFRAELAVAWFAAHPNEESS